MAKSFRLDVVSPEAIIWSGDAELLVTRTTEGEIGIMADHEPTMAALATGSTVVHPVGGKPVTIALHGGFLQIFQNEVTLLTDRAEISVGDADEARRLAREFAVAEVELEAQG
jgi:F-type H+-transporting ATPase subunit epsilon